MSIASPSFSVSLRKIISCLVFSACLLGSTTATAQGSWGYTHGYVRYDGFSSWQETAKTYCEYLLSPYISPKYTNAKIDMSGGILPQYWSVGFDCEYTTCDDKGLCSTYEITPRSGASYIGTPDYYVSESQTRDVYLKQHRSNQCVSNPIDPASGTKLQTETDIKLSSPSPLRFERYYRSRSTTGTNELGNKHWAHHYQRRLSPVTTSPNIPWNVSSTSIKYTTALDACEQGWPSVNKGRFGAGVTARYKNNECMLYQNGQELAVLNVFVGHIAEGDSYVTGWYLHRPNGDVIQFLIGDNGKFLPVENTLGHMEKTTTGYVYTDANDVREHYDNNGRLQSIEYSGGQHETLSYNANNQLQTVTDDLDQALIFGYDINGRIETLTTPGNRVWHYRYDTNGNLNYVDNPDTTTRQYHYENNQYPSALTGITDERRLRYSTYGYDTEGRATLSEHAGSAERMTLTYGNGVRTAYNSKGHSTTFNFITQNDRELVSDINGVGGIRCPGGVIHNEYDSENRLIARTVDGLTTTYGSFDVNTNKPTAITEADGTTEARNISIRYDKRFANKPTSIYQPSVSSGNYKLTSFRYDINGQLTTYKQFSNYTRSGNYSALSTTTFQYLAPLNQLSQIDGPRTDVLDISDLTYYADDALQGNNRARLKTISRAGLITRDNIQYSATGQVLSEQRLNGVTYSYTYYPGNDRLETLSQSDGTDTRTTRWTYLATGEVKSVTLGHGSLNATTVTLSYDDARRLTRITDGLGNYINYTLDTENNQTNEDVYDNTGVLQRSLSQSFDIYSNLDTSSQANELVDYNFNADGTLDTTTDGNGTLSQYSYDAIKRLSTITNDVGGLDANTQNTQTLIGYDVHDRATSITDPNHGNTTYRYDDFGNLLSQTSPDSGTTSYSYDLANNMLSRTDANGITLTYAYDALNRLTSITAPDVADSVSYVYDTCANGQGRLCSLTKNNLVTAYSYNAFGEVIQHQGVAYNYDDLGRINSITYPSGNLLSYSYNTAGQINSISLNDGTTTTTALASNIQYTAFGPVSNLTYGNGLALNQSHDSAYRLLNQTINGIQQQDYDLYDGNGNIKSITDSLATQTSTYNYDALNRLTTNNNSDTSQADWLYQYDRNGNRSQSSDGSNVLNGVYSANTNRLESWGTNTITLDAVGNTLSDGKHSYGYNQHHRLTSIDSNIQYSYNPLGQRIQKTVNGTITNYVYGLNGELLGEYDASGQTKAEYVYLNGQPLAVLGPGNVFVKQAVDKIIDNSDASATSSGTWITCSVTGYYGPDCFYLNAGTGSNTFTWTAPLEPGEYDVFEWHVSTTVSTSAAPYRISHANGTTSVPINQKINSGRWNRLGTFTFNASGQVSIDDSAPDGLVVADAVRFVRVVNNPGSARIIDNTDPGATSSGNWSTCTVAGYYGTDCLYLYAGSGSNTFSWSTSLEPGNYDVFEWHVATTVSTTAAPYQISHVNGTTTVPSNQQINSGQWNLLGNFSFASSGQVTIDDSASDGLVVADAVNFVRTDPGASQAKILYLHTDHLGTPRRASDETGNVVWRWQSDAFGVRPADEDPDGDGVATTINLRFAGQYYDSESGLHYNYFRYYDPSTGRYITSDPIGLAGGLNTYGYVGGNPLKYIDSLGLSAAAAPLPGVPGFPIFIPNTAPVGSPANANIGRGFVEFGDFISNHVKCGPYGCWIQLNEKADEGCPPDDKHPSTPTGQRGSPLDVAPGTNTPTNIGDRDYTGHAIDRMQGRGVPPSAVEDAIQNGWSIPGNQSGTTVHTGENGVTVVTGSDGQVITVIPK